MASFATIFDEIETRLGVLFPTYKRIPDPYNLSDNAETFLKGGSWGLGITPSGQNTQLFVSDCRSIEVQFLIPFVHEFISTKESVEPRVTAEKNLIADFETLVDDSHSNNLELSGGAIATAVSFAGILSISSERSNYRAINAVLTVKYTRN